MAVPKKPRILNIKFKKKPDHDVARFQDVINIYKINATEARIAEARKLRTPLFEGLKDHDLQITKFFFDRIGKLNTTHGDVHGNFYRVLHSHFEIETKQDLEDIFDFAIHCVNKQIKKNVYLETGMLERYPDAARSFSDKVLYPLRAYVMKLKLLKAKLMESWSG